ncbi:MAG: formate--tetrahydrofolate ligase [Candidatus Margulisiibacteriota bacterium]
MLSDIEIASKSRTKPIEKVASSCGLKKEELELYGTCKAKIKLSALEKRKSGRDGKLVLVTAVTPTPFGEGKTTVTIGLAQALKKLGKKAFVCIREPSLGPTLGLKGGAAGGGYSQVLPMEDINLHFTGDMHMVSAAHNLLAALIDNHIFHGNSLNIDPEKIMWNRVMDMNDRALRDISIRYRGVDRRSSFDITAASEVMASLCLSLSLEHLRSNLKKIVVGLTKDGRPVTAGDLKAEGSMAILLKEAIKPNLVQTIEGCPAFVHGGPFANIAHGCSSLIATKLALKLSDYVITEAGFGSDLGAEKFFDIKCRAGGLAPSAAVLVVTAKALKWQGGIAKDKYNPSTALRARDEDKEALKRGFDNLKAHIDALKNFNVPVVVAVNRFAYDSSEELKMICDECAAIGVRGSICDVREKGGVGGMELAKELMKVIRPEPEGSAPVLLSRGADLPAIPPSREGLAGGRFSVGTLQSSASGLKYLYDLNDSIEDKLSKIATKIYGADGIDFLDRAKQQLELIKQSGGASLPVCVAKTQFSLSDDHTRLGRPKGFRLTVKNIKPAYGAGFIVAYTGDIMTMPGLPQHPAAERIGLDENGDIKGLF